MKQIVSCLLAAALLLTICAGCASTAPAAATPSGSATEKPVAESTQPIADPTASPDSGNTPASSSDDMTDLTAGITAAQSVTSDPPTTAPVADFAFRWMQQAAAGGTNLTLSPASAYLALGMAAHGAGGTTRSEFEALLATSDIDGVSAALQEAAKQNDSSSDTVQTANSVWVDSSASVKDDYLSAMVGTYHGTVYAGKLATSAAMNAINEWISTQTKGLIPQMMNEPLPDGSQLTLINTLYFKGKWNRPFTKESTYAQPFTPEDGVPVDTDFMHQESDLAYLSADGVEGIVLDYTSETLKFVALRPTDGRSVDDLLSSLDASSFSSLVNGATTELVNLALPKFDRTYECTMGDQLKAMGLTTAFTDSADFSGISDTPLFLDGVLQKVKFILDEEGTEAAAATQVGLATAAYIDPATIKDLTFDTPFLYAVVDTSFGASASSVDGAELCATPLFLGIYRTPDAS